MFTVEWTGYLFTGDNAGVWTWSIYSDDSSYLWVGNNALSGYTTSNCLLCNGGDVNDGHAMALAPVSLPTIL
jgi:hypothetical protein